MASRPGRIVAVDEPNDGEEHAMTTTRAGETAATARRRDPRRRAGRPTGAATRDRLLAGMPVTERRLDVRGVSTAVLEGGDGPPVVLLHGAGEFAACWRPVLADLVRTHRVVVPDLPGHGASVVGGDRPDAELVAGWLAELVALTCPSPPVLVGHGLGGAVAARFAADQGERVAGLVLVDSYGLSRYRPAPRFALAMLGATLRQSERSQERLLRQCVADLDGLRERLGDWGAVLEAYALDQARSPGQKAALRGIMPSLGLPAIPPGALARISAPTTLIWGRHDRQVRLDVARAASARWGWPLHVVEDAADDPAVERPEAFLRVLRAALDPIDATDASAGGRP
jgi:pimeloyl-ACP methyl ester carboxylesterase